MNTTADEAHRILHPCDRAPSGSLFPREQPWSTARTNHCRSCGKELRYDRFGKFEHLDGAR